MVDRRLSRDARAAGDLGSVVLLAELLGADRVEQLLEPALGTSVAKASTTTGRLAGKASGRLRPRAAPRAAPGPAARRRAGHLGARADWSSRSAPSAAYARTSSATSGSGRSRATGSRGSPTTGSSATTCCVTRRPAQAPGRTSCGSASPAGSGERRAVCRARAKREPQPAAYSCQVSGMPLSVWAPRSLNSIPEPATRSFTVRETSTSPGPRAR